MVPVQRSEPASGTLPVELSEDENGDPPKKKARSHGSKEKRKARSKAYEKLKRQYPGAVPEGKVVWVPHRNGQCAATVLSTTAAKKGDLGDTVTVKRLYDGTVEQHLLGPKAQQVSLSLRKTDAGVLTRAEARAATPKDAFTVPRNLVDAPRVVPSDVVEADRQALEKRVVEFAARRSRLAKPAPTASRRFPRASFFSLKEPKKKRLIIEACAGTGVLSYYINGYGKDLDVATLTIDHDMRCGPDLVKDVVDVDYRFLCDTFHVIGLHVAVPCEAGCKSAAKDYKRHTSLLPDHGSDLSDKCHFRVDNQSAVMRWAADAAVYMMSVNPGARVSMECTAANYLFKTPAYERFLELTGAVEVPYDHCAFGLGFVKTGLLVTNLYTLPGKGDFAAWRCPIGGCHGGTEDHPHRALTSAELAQAAVYPEPVAKAWARGWVDHFYRAWFFPKDFSKISEEFEARRKLYGFGGSRRFTAMTS